MGYYINTKEMTKEEWLTQNSIPQGVSALDWNVLDTKVTLPVCLVDNGVFKAAGIAYSEDEFKAFNDPSDTRAKVWYVVKIEDLLKVSDLATRFQIKD